MQSAQAIILILSVLDYIKPSLPGRCRSSKCDFYDFIVINFCSVGRCTATAYIVDFGKH